MTQKISKLGKTLSKKEQSDINGGWLVTFCQTWRDCMGPLDGPADWSCVHRGYVSRICVPN